LLERRLDERHLGEFAGETRTRLSAVGRPVIKAAPERSLGAKDKVARRSSLRGLDVLRL
jgi:hypothetical protein